MIPKVVHRVAIGPVPDKYDEYWAKWQTLNPGWEFKTWVDPFDPADWETGPFFAEASCESQMSDFLRFEIVWREGGIYTDWDVEPLKPFDRFLNHECFIGSEDGGRHLSPGLFGAVAGHPAVRACIDSHLGHRWTRNPSSTGPGTATRCMRRDDVHIVDTGLFYPYHYSEPHRAGEDFPDAYSVHHWGYSWAHVV